MIICICLSSLSKFYYCPVIHSVLILDPFENEDEIGRRIVATQAYPGWPLSCGRVAVLDCVPAPAGPVQNGVSGAAAVKFLRVGPALSIGAFARL
jgi:hypothetical protein